MWNILQFLYLYKPPAPPLDALQFHHYLQELIFATVPELTYHFAYTYNQPKEWKHNQFLEFMNI